MIAAQSRGCLGHYNFQQIAYYAKKRFIEGYQTVELLQQAKSESEKEEIALVCMLDVEDDQIRDLQLSCKYAEQCQITDCRDRLRRMIQADLGNKLGVVSPD